MMAVLMKCTGFDENHSFCIIFVMLVGWLFNDTSTQKGQFVGERNRLNRLRMANEIQYNNDCLHADDTQQYISLKDEREKAPSTV